MQKITKLLAAWTPVVARILFGLQFLMGAFYKIPGTQSFYMEVGMTGAAGVLFPIVMVTLAFLVEAIGGLALVVGWHVRSAAAVLAVFALGLGFVFYNNLSDQMQMAEFISCVSLMAGLFYVASYGTQRLAVKKDPLP